MTEYDDQELEKALWQAFAGQETYWPVNGRKHFENAVYEGMKRLSNVIKPLPCCGVSYMWDFEFPIARKEHTCERNHIILPGQMYVKYQLGVGWGDYIKMCVSCSAMLLYFQDVHLLPPYMENWARD